MGSLYPLWHTPPGQASLLLVSCRDELKTENW